MNLKRILSLFLAVLTLCGVFTAGMTTGAAAASTEESGPALMDDDYETATKYALLKAFTSPEKMFEAYTATDGTERPAYMVLTTRKHGYELYCNYYTGEIAYRNVVTGQIITSNPYNLGTIGEKTKEKLLSQIEVKFVDNANQSTSLYSFTEAAQRGQIEVKTIQDGLRVEYTMGRVDTSYLLPIYIEKSRFEECLLAPMKEYLESLPEDGEAYETMEFMYEKFVTYYTLYDPNDTTQNAETIENMMKQYPVLKDTNSEGKHMAIYVLSAKVDKEKRLLEGLVKSYCPDYTQEELQYDHEMTKPPVQDAETPVFRMAIEYVIQEDGLRIRLPANGIRFDETKYRLTYVRMLQFFGAGDLNNSDGYVFYPDGSGALIDFGDFYSSSPSGKRVAVELSGYVYGDDYAYYNISNAKHQEIIRMPVFGVVDPVTTTTTKPLPGGGFEYISNTVTKGFLAVLEEGASLAQISCSFGASTHNFGSVFTTFYPRPSDTYNMKDVISVGDNKDWTVVSDKKYNGNYVLKVTMLTDPAIGAEKVAEGTLKSFYETSYVGMAQAYQNYLIRNNVLTALTNVKSQLPLYIESFGSFETMEKILSIPINMDVPLTTFEDVEKMYDELSALGINNINFQLTGFANGGMESTYPAKVDWMGACGGGGGFQTLLDHANEKKFGVYPDFDFLYISETALFDGVSLMADCSRAVDDRYCSKQFYDALYQEFVSYFDLVVTPSSIKNFTKNFINHYNNKNAIGISVSSMGSELNSDFNVDNLYNRDDAQKVYANALATLKENYGSVMTKGGNAYTLKYVDHLLEAAVDSSRFKYNSHSVPFVGMVLHGYMNYAGPAINKSGDGGYQLLKAIESGAALYYTLSYQDDNIIKLKDDKKLSQNYSIRYSIWKDSLVNQYHALNDAIGDLQNWLITDHCFLIAERVPDATEKALESEKLSQAIIDALDAAYDSAEAVAYRRLNIQQVTIQLRKKGITDRETMYAEVTDRLYNIYLSDAEKQMIDTILDNYTGTEQISGQTVSIYLDKDAIVASIESVLGSKLEAEQIAVLDAYIAEKSSNEGQNVETVTSVNLRYTVPTTDSFATDKKYDKTQYTDASGSVVMVTYSNGTEEASFLLNYNTFDVVIRLEGKEPITLPAYGFVRL